MCINERIRVWLTRATPIALVLVLLAFGASQAGSRFQKGTTVTFIHLNDLHAHLVPRKDLVRDGNEARVVEHGGLARIATAIKTLRKDNPNSVLMNIGDTYHGGVEALYTNGNAIVDPVNALGVDVGVPGNWDFAYGPPVTRGRYGLPARRGMFKSGPIKKPNFPNLAANVTITMPMFRRGQHLMPPTLVKEVGGVKVGFIGITSDIVPRMHKMLAMGLKFLDYSTESYTDLIDKHAKELRAQGAQVVVVMSELGIHKDYTLADHVRPGSVDVFFSAHTHEATFEPLRSASGALVVEAGHDGYLGRMDITVHDGKVVDREWELLEVDARYAEDRKVKRLVEAARAPFLAANVDMDLPSMASGLQLTRPIDTVIGYTKQPLNRRQALENDFNNVVTDIMRKAGNTQLAISPGFRFDAVIPAKGALLEHEAVADGAITLEDVYRFFPVPYTVSVGKVSGQRLKEVIESNLTAVFSPDTSLQSGGWTDGFAGLKLNLDLARPDGKRVLDMRLKDGGQRIKPGDRLTVTGCSRPFDREAETTLCSYDGFENVQLLSRPDSNAHWTAIELFVYAVENGWLPDTHRHDIADKSHTEMWPADTFYQPIRGVSTKRYSAK